MSVIKFLLFLLIGLIVSINSVQSNSNGVQTESQIQAPPQQKSIHHCRRYQLNKDKPIIVTANKSTKFFIPGCPVVVKPVFRNRDRPINIKPVIINRQPKSPVFVQPCVRLIKRRYHHHRRPCVCDSCNYRRRNYSWNRPVQRPRHNHWNNEWDHQFEVPKAKELSDRVEENPSEDPSESTGPENSDPKTDTETEQAIRQALADRLANLGPGDILFIGGENTPNRNALNLGLL